MSRRQDEAILKRRARQVYAAREAGKGAPSFSATWRAAELRQASDGPFGLTRAPVWAGAVGMAIGVLAIVVWRAQQPLVDPNPQQWPDMMSVLHSSTQWHAPTDALLATHQSRLYQELPSLTSDPEDLFNLIDKDSLL